MLPLSLILDLESAAPPPATSNVAPPPPLLLWWFLSRPAAPTPPPTPPTPLAYRDWDVIEAIQAVLDATGSFDVVQIGALPSAHGDQAAHANAVFLEYLGWREQDEWDDEDTIGQSVTSEFRITLMVRDDDPLVRDRRADQLTNVCRDALQAKALISGFLNPDRTRLKQGSWQTPTAPTRVVIIAGEYSYDISGSQLGPQGYATTD